MSDLKEPLAYRFGKWAEGLKYESLPKEVIENTRLYILDWFGCCIAATDLPSTQSILKTARELNGRADVTVLGSGEKMEPTLAAMVNGTMSHSLEMDDDHRTLCGHPAAPVIPAALAISEKLGLDGKKLIEAVVVGYEMIIRSATCFLGRAYYEGWHPTSTCGVFGAAAAAAKAMGLDSGQTATAFSLAGSMAGGTLEFHFEGSFAKRFHPGNAARNGILAAMMARDGFTGPWRIFEGEYGFFNTHCKKDAELDQDGRPVVKNVYDPNIMIDQLGERYDLMTNSFKVHAGGRFGATSIDACLELVNRYYIQPKDVAEIRIGACDFTMRAHFSETAYRPKNIVNAQFSLPFAVALVLLYRKVSVRQLTEENWTDPKIIEIMDKVTKYVDTEAEAAYPDHYMSKVTIILKDGTERKARIDYPRGDPENRPTNKELYDKFRELAGMTLSDEKVERLLEALIGLEQTENVGSITALTIK
jgi:2-methylcitrate dehydratase PrpD